MARKGQMEMPTTPKRRELFLKALRASGGVFAEACRISSPHLADDTQQAPAYSTWRNLMRRDPEFAAAVEEVLAQCKEDIEAEIYRRGQLGWTENVYQKGQQAVDAEGKPATIRRYSDRLLLKRAAALMPDRYGEKTTHEYRGFINVHAGALVLSAEDFVALNVEQRQQLKEILTVIRDHREGKGLPYENVPMIESEYAEIEDEDSENE